MRKIYAIIAMMLLAVCPKAMAEETASEKVIAWSAPANYNSPGLEQNFAVTIVAYTDGTYAIKGVYGSEYDLEFTVDNESVINGKPEIVFTNAYSVQATYYYISAGDYKICAYYAKGTGYTAWEGDTETPGVWFYNYLYQGDNYLGAGYDFITWNASDIVTAISSVKAETSASGRITSITGIDYGKASKLPAGLYVKNGKKFIAR